MKINIRQENKKDYIIVYKLVEEAFKNAEHSDGDEQNFVNRLRKSDNFIPELSLVAEYKGEIVGHILFTETKINQTNQLILAPLSVAPLYQNCGIGSKLIKEGHKIAKNLGYEFSILIGHANYYPRLGYIMASSFGMKTTLKVPDENFLAFNLQEKDTILNGYVNFDEM